MNPDAILLAVLFFAAALLYSSVGHAGASGYLAAMALVGLAPESMKPTALLLNVLVASIATLRFSRAGYFDWQLLWPFAVGSVPLAFLGGALSLPGRAYRVAVGVVLLLAAVQLLRSAKARMQEAEVRARVHVLSAVSWGALIGLVSGLTGTGGGIFLSPLLLLLRWAETKESAGVSAAFILLNSLAGFAGNTASVRSLPEPFSLCLWLAAAGVGGLIGSHIGTRRIGVAGLRRLLAIVLLVAAIKLCFG